MKEIASALAGLVETVERATESGDWKVDGACDPELDLERARRALRGLEFAGAEAEMAKVKVRVAVAVDTKGRWDATGNHRLGNYAAACASREMVPDTAAIYWLEAELDVPQETVMQAVVTKDGEP